MKQAERHRAREHGCKKIVRRQFREWIQTLEAALANPGPDQLTPVQIGYWLSPAGREAKVRDLRAYWCH